MPFQPTMVRDWERWHVQHPNATETEQIEAAITIWNDGFDACHAYCAAVDKRLGLYVESETR